MFNIDSFINEMSTDEFVYINDVNPDIQDILKPFFTNSQLKAVKYTRKHVISIGFPEDNLEEVNKNIICDKRANVYYYNFELPVANSDIITNIQCDNEIDLLLHGDACIQCNINKLTLPIFYMQKCPALLSIKLNNVVDTEIIPEKIIVTYDTYLLETNIGPTLIKNGKDEYINMSNDEAIVFRENIFNGFTDMILKK
jgi:hypothetical protein